MPDLLGKENYGSDTMRSLGCSIASPSPCREMAFRLSSRQRADQELSANSATSSSTEPSFLARQTVKFRSLSALNDSQHILVSRMITIVPRRGFRWIGGRLGPISRFHRKPGRRQSVRHEGGTIPGSAKA